VGDPLRPPKRLPVAAGSPVEKCGGISLDELGLYSPPRRRGGGGTDSGVAVAAVAAAGDSAAAGEGGSELVIDWAAPIQSTWEVSEAAAISMLDTFIADGMRRYELERSFADARGVSKISPYLHFGQLSPRLVWQKLRLAQ
jgi:hypothetical protein